MEQLQAQADGAEVPPEPLDATLAALPLAIGADGVMVPFRPTPKTAKGKTRWREVKVGILARLGTRLTRAHVEVPRLLHRRLVAMLGDIDQFIPHLQLEAQRQAFESAPQVIWLSDGGRGFWRVYRTCFAHCAVAVLDFYHAAGHLARATQAMFGESHSAQAKAWFRCWRHLLRHGRTLDVLRALTGLLNSGLFSGAAFTTLVQVQAYFQRHYQHCNTNSSSNRRSPSALGWSKVLASGSFSSASKALACAGAKMVSTISFSSDSPGPISALIPSSQTFLGPLHWPPRNARYALARLIKK